MGAQQQEKTRVLLVEDNASTREALAYLLQREGYAVDSAGDGKEGLELLCRFPHPSIVLLDLDLPVVNGFEFLRRQKQDPEVADVPVVVITASSDPLLPKVQTVLTKPVDFPLLMAVLSGHHAPEMSIT